MRNTKSILLLSACLLSACTDSEKAIRALQGAGYQRIEITGYSVFGCSEEDTFRTAFKATSSNGQPVEGVVCSGVFKGATIRTE